MIGVLTQLSPQEELDFVLREYDLYPNQIENLGKVQRLYTQRGGFALKRASFTPDQAELVFSFQKKLQEREYPHFLAPLQNKYGDSFVPIQQEYYYLLPWVEDKVEMKYSNDWEKKTLIALAKLHQITSDFAQHYGLQQSLSSKQLLSRWNARLLQMHEFKNFALDREMMSPIETVFVQHFEYLIELSSRAIKYLKEWEKRGQHENQAPQLVLCHGHVHRNHVIHPQNKESCLINFDYAKIDSPARDLALFYRRHLNKAFDIEGTALEWLEIYEAHFPLGKMDKMLLAIYLLFPERVFKEIENYYQAVRNWHPLKQARFLEKQIKYTYAIRRFVKKILG